MNIVKFHGYWQDRTKNDDRPRVNISLKFIIYYLYSIIGSLYYRIYVKWIIKTFFT